jgi:hypothetical protein
MKQHREERIHANITKMSVHKINIKLHTNFEVYRFVVDTFNVYKISIKGLEPCRYTTMVVEHIEYRP